MEPVQQSMMKDVANEQVPESSPDLYHELMLLGFEETLIKESLTHTLDKDKAVEIILRYNDLGVTADVSDLRDIVPIVQESKPSKSPGLKYKMIFLVNGSLKMGKGKICAQVGHACLSAYLQMEDKVKYSDDKYILKGWEAQGCAKIVVKVDSTLELLELEKIVQKKGINCYLVQDAGRTQVKSGSQTVLGIGPAESWLIDSITSHLKLL